MQQYSPKLKKAMSEIQEILERHDIGASIALHTPGHAETFMKVNPSYSCAFIGEMHGKQAIRVRTRLDEDFQGDVAKRNKSQEDTVNMFVLMAETVGHQALNYMEMVELLETKFDIESTDKGFTSSSTQNN